MRGKYVEAEEEPDSVIKKGQNCCKCWHFVINVQSTDYLTHDRIFKTVFTIKNVKNDVAVKIFLNRKMLNKNDVPTLLPLLQRRGWD